MDLLYSCVLYMYGFDFFSFTQIFIIGHKGIIFFPEKKILLQIAFF